MDLLRIFFLNKSPKNKTRNIQCPFWSVGGEIGNAIWERTWVRWHETDPLCEEAKQRQRERWDGE